jgi:hypothetical protein
MLIVFYNNLRSTPSPCFFWNEEERVRLDKILLEFLAYKEEASKRMEEIRKRIESFSPPRTSPASQAPPIQPTPPATRSDRMMPKPQVVLETQTTTPTSLAATVTKKRKKKAVEATKIHPHLGLTKLLLTGFRSAHPSRTSRNHRTQTSKRTVINSRRASMSHGVTCVHCGEREIKKRALVWVWFGNKKYIDEKRRSRDPNHYKKET